MNTMSLGAAQRHTQTVSPRLQHAVRLLQMSSLDFAALVRDALNSNPFLEADDLAAATDNDDGELPVAQSDDAGALVEPDVAGEDRELWRVDATAAARPSDDREFSALERAPLEITLAAHLCSQLNVMPLPERDWRWPRRWPHRSTTMATCARRWTSCSTPRRSTRRPTRRR